MKRMQTTGERIRARNVRRECAGWAVACIVAGACLCAVCAMRRGAERVQRVTMEVRK
jgi:hypothetical protein